MKDIEKQIRKATTLLEALPYLQNFRNKYFVIKIGGSLMENEEKLINTMRDIVFMELVGINPIIVHGGGKKISKKLTNTKLATKFVNGIRYTCKDSLEIVKNVLEVDISPVLKDYIINHGGKAKCLSGLNVFSADKLIIDDGKNNQDIGWVGKVTDVNNEEIFKVLNNEEVPVVTPVSKYVKRKNDEPQYLNVNADHAALALAKSINADKLIFISDVLGVMQNPEDSDTLIPTLNEDKVKNLIDNKTIQGGMIPKTLSALDALKNGVKKVHMIDGRIQHSLLLEVFTDKGIGTQFVI